MWKGEKIPVCYTIEEVESFLNRFKDHKFVFYLAHKDSEGWEKSTSRVYMNQVFPNMVYLPIDIEKDDLELLRDVYHLAQKSEQVIAINQTQPHKSNPMLKKFFHHLAGVPVNIDAIIKNKEGQFEPYDLNGPSFTIWFLEEVDDFENKVVVLFGVGGVGEPIARGVVHRKPKRLVLIDPLDKTHLQTELSRSCTTDYFSGFKDSVLSGISYELIVINAAGKEGVENNSTLFSLLAEYRNKNHIFVDLRPQLQLDIVERAKEFGWRAYTGYGMNARNDYTLVGKLAEILNVSPLSFSDFKELVAQAS